MKPKQTLKVYFKYYRRITKRQFLMSGVMMGLVLIVASGAFYQNVHAANALHNAQASDKKGDFVKAQTQLQAARGVGTLPNITKEVKNEQLRLTKELNMQDRLQFIQKLLREHKTAQALSLLKTVTASGGLSSNQSQQVAALQKAAQKQGSSNGSSSSSSGSGSSSGGGSGSGTGGSSGGGSPPPPPPPPGPMSQITVNSFTASSSPSNATHCNIAEAVNFSVNGSGNVNVTFKELSTKTSSAIENLDVYSFSAAGSQADSRNGSWQGLEPGDSYNISVTITNTSNSAITVSAGPINISSCAAPQALLTPGQTSYMSSPVSPGSLVDYQVHDSIFPNECNMNVQVTFSVTGPGSIQAVYTITSASSGGATLYSLQQEDFTGPGSDSDSSYIRMPHLAAGDNYTVTVKLNVLGDPAHSATSAPISSGCS